MMTILELVFLLCLFVTVFSLMLFSMNKFKTSPTKKRIGNYIARENADVDSSEFVSTLVKVVDPISKISLPSEGWDKSPMYLKFVNAGWRGQDAPKLYFGTKTLMTFGFPLLVYTFLDKSVQANNAAETIFLLFMAAALGYYIPNAILSKVVINRQLEISETLPDATDLLIICMEAGLSFDQALGKVASEIKLKSEVLSQELELVLLEVRSGFSRERGLRNLALRTGVEELDSLASMVIQSERFGTSIGDALRVHAETARTRRRQKAEETASKIALKLLFPLILCLLPAIFVVLLVPSFMQIKAALS